MCAALGGLAGVWLGVRLCHPNLLELNATAGVQYLRARPRLIKGIQLVLLVLTVGFCVWAVRDQWSKAGPLLANASPAYLALEPRGRRRLLPGVHPRLDPDARRVGHPCPYRVALQAEMVSMLAKYLPGGVWTPAARAVALRRYAGITETPTVLASILVEAALSAISGVIVFVISLAWVRDVEAPLLPLVAVRSAAAPPCSTRGSSGRSSTSC